MMNEPLIQIFPNFFSIFPFEELVSQIPWSQKVITLYGKTLPIPRMEAWYGPSSYTYSKKEMRPSPIFPELTTLMEEVNGVMNSEELPLFNCCLANFYRDGKDSMGWHRDNELVFGEHPVIGSVSFGSSRVFKFRRYKDPFSPVWSYELHHGDLLIMLPGVQENFEHCLVKTSKKIGPRWNFTFRKMIT